MGEDRGAGGESARGRKEETPRVTRQSLHCSRLLNCIIARGQCYGHRDSIFPYRSPENTTASLLRPSSNFFFGFSGKPPSAAIASLGPPTQPRIERASSFCCGPGGVFEVTTATQSWRVAAH